MKPIAIIEAPSILGLRPTGVEELPAALVQAGLVERLAAHHAGRVDPPVYSAVRDPDTGFLNPHAIASYSRFLASRVGDVLAADQFPLVIGGDCSILLGSLLAMRRRGSSGLLFLDGHTDFYDAQSNVNGEVASSELALATGRGPAVLTTYDGLCPLVQDQDVVVFGYRDERESQDFGSPPLPAEMPAFSLSDVRKVGVDAAAQEAVTRVAADGAFWIHLDADVLDDAIMPAVDYRLPGGLSWDELEVVLATALARPEAAGMELTIFNPSLDVDRAIAREFVQRLYRALRVCLN